MTSLHDQIRKRAQESGVVIQALKPNSRQIAKRMVEQGQLVKDGMVWRWHESRASK